MAIANTRVHIICGICGSNEYMKYKVERDTLILNEGEENEIKKDQVFLSCDNCGSLTGLDELMGEDED